MQFDELFDHAMLFSPASAGSQAVDAGGADPAEQVARGFPGGGGVYLLTDEADRLVQLAATGDLRRALRARLLDAAGEEEPGVSAFQRRRAKLGEVVRKIRWRPTHSMFEVTYEYHRLARLIMPAEYLESLAFGPAWFVSVDPDAPIPRLAVGKILRSPPGVDLGPFATHGDATRFVQILEDAFDLCRHYNILEQAPAGQPCAYHEMGKCPAPCDGSVPLSQYREMVASALSFACGRRDRCFREWQDEMRSAAAAQEYERAAAIKQRIERAGGVGHRSFSLAGPISSFDYLIVQRGGGRTRLKPFFVRAGRITPGEVVRLRDLDSASARWTDEMRKPHDPAKEPALPCADDRQTVSEQVWLVSHFLFKPNPPGVCVRGQELGEPASLADAVRQHFASSASNVDGEGQQVDLPATDAD